MTLRASKRFDPNDKKAKYRMHLKLVEAIQDLLLVILKDLKKNSKTKKKPSSVRQLKPRGAAPTTHH
jgi:predicted RNA-binding protein with PUA-like domain